MASDRGSRRWAQDSFGTAKLADKRRTARLVKLASDLAGSAGQSPARASGQDEAAQEAAYRFLGNDAVEPAAVAEAGYAATVAGALQVTTLLAVEDTTTLSYTHQVASELGDLGGPAGEGARGFFVHSVLMLDAATGAAVGLVEQDYWQRQGETRGKRHRRRQRPYEEKESFKWQQASQRIRARLGQELMGRTISVCDREADIYEYLSYKTGHQERFVIRASWDRGVEVEDDAGERGRLFSVVEAARQHGRLTVDVAQRGGRAARRAEVTLRATRVWLRRPGTGRSELPARLGVNVVVAREEQPPVGVEPLEWVLLTSEPIDTGEQVVDVVRLYRLRWRIEDFHKAWKSGAGVERSRLQSADNLQRLAVILAFVAVRLLQLRDLQQAEPDAPCDRQLNATEWRVLWAVIEKTPPPSKVPSARWAYRAIGRLGGWHDTKHTGRVGWAAYWDGWHQLEFHITGYHAALLLQGLEK